MKNEIKKCTGIAIPLGAIRTENSSIIGEYTALEEFAEFCKKCGFSVIQLLPILDTGTQSSPYSSLSAFALHPIYININNIKNFEKCYSNDSEFKRIYDELLSLADYKRFDYERVLNLKEALLRKIFFVTRYAEKEIIDEYQKDYFDFLEENAEWLKPYCVFKNLKYKYMQAGWKNWQKEDINLSKEEILARWNDNNLKNEHHFYAWEQFIAHLQLENSSQKVRELGIILKGDLPILLNEDSCDVWGTPEIFNMKLRAGSPPDGDNPTGQNWGFPVYDWTAQAKNDYSWWKLRLSLAEKYFGAYRLDHIPGFFRFWATHVGEETAELGGTVPNATISQKSLENIGFSKERIRWLKEPHISTEDFFRKTGNFEKTHAILSIFCERIGHEELWLFKKDFKSTEDIRKVSLEQFELDEQIQREIKELLCQWWKNRTLIEVKKGQYLPYFRFSGTRAWNSLNQYEKDELLKLFDAANKKQEKLWEKQSNNIFSSIIPSTNMVPCGEDLGIEIECMPRTLEKFGILGLKVVRWCRKWSENGQPFEDFTKYRQNSLVTTSVHDSSTMRQWWNSEKDSTKAFCLFVIEKRKTEKSDKQEMNAEIWGRRFDPTVAEFVLSNVASTSGAWFVNPIQDWLYLDSEFYSEDADEERINIPGTVTKFNWTWRMPCNVSKISEKIEMIEKIKRIVEIHDK